jgi:hypothetical protein
LGKNNATCKVFAQAFFKKLAVSKGSALVARRNERNFLNGAFLFAKLFLLRLVCQKKKRYRRRIFLKIRNGTPRTSSPTGLVVFLKLLPIGEDIILPPCLMQ